jgi:hypothetical protein
VLLARDRTTIALSAMMMMVGLATTGCRSDLSLSLERRRPAAVSLPDVKRLGVLDLSGPDGAPFAAAVRARVSDSGAFLAADPERLDQASGAKAAELGDSAAARIAREGGVDAVVVGRVVALEVSRVIETRTSITKRVPGGGSHEVATVRKLRTGRLQVEHRVVQADGRVVRGRPVTRDFRAERVEDPEPTAETIAPHELPKDAIPEVDEVKDVLVRAAANEVADQLIPRRELANVTWEDAGGADADARERFSRREVEEASRLVRGVLADKTRALDAETQAALLHDLGVCEDLLGDVDHAERHLDEALSIKNSELHQRTLRDLRRRREAREGSP